MSEKLTYDDVKLGEKAVELRRTGASQEEIAEKTAVYLNTQKHFYGLNNTDMIVADVLRGGNTLVVGRSGCGKSQLAEDICNYFFGGSIDMNGRGLIIEGNNPDLRIMEDVFTTVNREEGRRVLNHRVGANFVNFEEFNRSPEFTQNQYMDALNRRLIWGGQKVVLGDGFCSSIATGNLGNGEYKGTFESDKALYNRFGLVVNLDEPEFRPSFEDREMMERLRPADAGIKRSPIRDITGKIIQASEKIKESTLELNLESEAVLKFLRDGLDNCSQHHGTKDLEWHFQNRTCQECPKNADAPQQYALCSMVQSPVTRTLNNIRSYAAALDYLMKLKGVGKECPSAELIFKAFELTSAYQGALNPFILKRLYHEKASSMMKDVVGQLKEDYKRNEDRILTALEAAQRGVKPSSLFYLTLPKSSRVLRTDYGDFHGKVQDIQEAGGEVSRKEFEFDDNGVLGYSWVEKSANLSAEEATKESS